MKIINNTDRDIELQLGNKRASEPDYRFILKTRNCPSQKIDDEEHKVDLEKKGIDLEQYDLLVICPMKKGRKYHE